MDEVVSSNPEAVAVAAGHNHIQVVICEFDTRCHGQRPAVKRVHAVSFDVAWKVGRASDSTDRYDFVGLNLQFYEGLLERSQNSEISATRTPVRVDLSFIIRYCQFFLIRL